MPHGGSVDCIYPCKNASLNTSMPLPMSGSYPREPLFFLGKMPVDNSFSAVHYPCY